jgi:D-amino-acid dehydrogenase
MTASDVVVVGGGAIGAAAALELSRRGAAVTLLDRDGDGSGCSFGNAGLICPSHAEALASPGALLDGLGWMLRRDSPFHLRPRSALLPWLARFALAARPARSARSSAVLRELAQASLERHGALADAGLPTSFVRRGILSVYDSERSLEAARAALPVGSEVLDAATARSLQPALAEDRIAGAVYHPREGHCDPRALVEALLGAAREAGAEVRSGVEVLRLRRSDGRITGLDTTAGPLPAGAVVLAAGAWTRELAAGVGVRIPLEAAKGYHVELDADGIAAPVPVYMEDARVVATPLAGRLRVAGTLELSGLDLSVDHVRLAALARAARRTLALPRDARTLHVWRGLRPCAPDGLPIVGAADGVENLVIATGHAMLGVTLAPVTGEIVACLLSGEQPDHPVQALAPSRFRTLWRSGA